MERLTNKREADAQREGYERRLANGYQRSIPVERFLRLAAYEDSELEPEEVSALIKDWSDLRTIIGECGGLDRLRELAKADKDGRVVVLPCKVSQRVFALLDTDKHIRECEVKQIGMGNKIGFMDASLSSTDEDTILDLVDACAENCKVYGSYVSSVEDVEEAKRALAKQTARCVERAMLDNDMFLVDGDTVRWKLLLYGGDNDADKEVD